jgi:predicted DNA-binding protein with PD1-like motif
VADQEGRMYGGHFFPDGTPVYVTFELCIHEFLEIEHFMNLDEASGIPLIEVKQD